MLKIFQACLQQYMNHELPDVQAGFRKGTGTRDQTAKIWVQSLGWEDPLEMGTATHSSTLAW